MLEKFTICRDDQWYLAWPDVALTTSGKLVCVFAECKHHGDRSYTRIMCCDSADRGRTWSPKRPVTPPAHFSADHCVWWNCPRITALADGRLVVVVDYCENARPGENKGMKSRINRLYISSDEGRTWQEGPETPARGIVPDKLHVLRDGRWLFTTHYRTGSEHNHWRIDVWISPDHGKTWQEPVCMVETPELKLCEGSVLELPGGELVYFLRENSGLGRDAYKCISRDGGATWSPPLPFPLPGCHRPVSGLLQDGRVLITYRFMQGGKGWLGTWTQNFFAALTDQASTLAGSRQDTWTRIMPIDYDRSLQSDLGYSGWVQFPDGEIYIVNYIVDDWPRGQIRGYALRPEDFMLQYPLQKPLTSSASIAMR